MIGSKKNLILFTLQYPYSNTESFLETEIPHLLKEFDSITIVPRDLHENRREIAEGVIVDTSFSKSIPTGLSMLLAIIKAIFSNVDIIKEVVKKPQVLKKFKSIKLLLYYGVIKEVIKKWNNGIEIHYGTIFYTYWIESFTYGLCELKKVHGIKVVSRTHRYDLYEERHSRPFLPFRSQIFDVIDKIYPVSSEGEKYLLNKYKVDSSKVELSRLGIHGQNKRTMKPIEDQFSVVSCSNVIKLKRIDLIIESIAQFAQQNPDLAISWVHFGNGELFDEIKKYAQIKLASNVEWRMSGVVRNREVLDYYTSNPINVLINLSSIEGVPVSIMEAFNCAIPVIATDVGGVKEIVNDSNGILLGANPHVDDVVSALQRLANADFETLKKLQESTFATWKNKYDAELNYSEFATTVAKLVPALPQ